MSRRQITNLDALLVEVCTDSIKPPVRIRTDHRELAGGKLLLLVEVPRGDSLHEGAGRRLYPRRRVQAPHDERRATAPGAATGARRAFAGSTSSLWRTRDFRTLDEALWKPLLSAEGAADPEAALMKLALLAPDEAGVTRATAGRRPVLHAKS